MSAIKINEAVFWVGAMHWDRRLFDELIPLPDGTSYNSYVIKGSEKTALIDTVDPDCEHQLFKNLQQLNIKKIDYVISNHSEQDHSGIIPRVLSEFPQAQLVTNSKAKTILSEHLEIPENKFKIVENQDVLSLGDRKLKFVMTPWVHWPETMTTYLEEDGIAFSCDFFGSHLATSQLFTDRDPKVLRDAKRYYAEIMMPFRNQITRNIAEIKSLNPSIIAPSHGPVYRDPEFIISAYEQWSSDKVLPQVVIPYVSMHGSTARIVDYLVDKFMEIQIEVFPFNITVSDIGEIAMSLVDASTVILASPTVLTVAHPSTFYVAYLLGALRPKTKYIGLVGSYGWGGRMAEVIKPLLANLNAEFLNPILIKGYPRQADYDNLDKLVEMVVAKNS
ncbi:MAG: MBL fold metallo-hydrolase [Desulfuromonas sp. SDB]|nr:MAG: MBL fold metallo-hydrolase [Desulfuromonas sp. SDB]